MEIEVSAEVGYVDEVTVDAVECMDAIGQDDILEWVDTNVVWDDVFAMAPDHLLSTYVENHLSNDTIATVAEAQRMEETDLIHAVVTRAEPVDIGHLIERLIAYRTAMSVRVKLEASRG